MRIYLYMYIYIPALDIAMQKDNGCSVCQSKVFAYIYIYIYMHICMYI